MKQRIITGFFFVLAVLLFMIPGFFQPLILCFFLAIIGILGSFELVRAWSNIGHQINKLLLTAAALSCIPTVVVTEYLSLYEISSQNWLSDLGIGLLCGFTTLIIISLISFYPLIFSQGIGSIKNAVITLLSQLYLAIPLILGTALIILVPRGREWFYLAIITPWICDTSAYFIGSFLGKKKWVPELSPKKTYAGFYGGLAGTVILYLIAFNTVITDILPLVSWRFIAIICLGIANGILAQLGDLSASAIKRYTAIKDFSDILPGHGGALDRFDSTLFVLPSTFIMAVVFALGG